MSSLPGRSQIIAVKLACHLDHLYVTEITSSCILRLHSFMKDVFVLVMYTESTC